ncbi:hypothetical protein [Persicitalea sp.]|uniref:hypothetical protein n=1 Tax=Persicitalea sp. TaxID=3100273 RepID=UPI003593CCAB
MKRSNYLLKIDDPCPESWAAMSPTDSGRFCASCAKNVIDFTNLSDDQVLAIIKISSGNLCGRMEESQMNRFLVSKAEPSNKARFFRLIASLFLISAGESQAQELIVREPMAMVKPPTQQEKFEKEVEDGPDYRLKIWVKSRVVSSETEEPVSKAYILPRRTNITTLTDDGGYFELLLPDSLAEEQIRITIFRHDIGQNNITAAVAEFPEVIELAPFIPTKTISGGGLTVVKRKWWQRRRKDCK